MVYSSPVSCTYCKLARADTQRRLTSKGLLSQFKTSRLSNLKLDPASLKKHAQSAKPVGHLTTSKNAYHLFPSSKPKASSSSSSQKHPKHPNLEQEPDLRPSLVDSMLPADQVGRGARSAGDTDRDLEREGVVKAELGLDGGKFAGAEEMQGLRLVVPDGRRQGFYLGESRKIKCSMHLLADHLQQLLYSPLDISCSQRTWGQALLPKTLLHWSTLPPPRPRNRQLNQSQGILNRLV